MKRILYISSAGDRGGAEVVLLQVLCHLDRSRFEPIVACLRDGPLVEMLCEEAGVDATVMGWGRFRELGQVWRVVRRLRDLIDARDISLVHSNGTLAHLVGGIASRGRVPNIYHLHDVPDRGWSRQGLLHWLAGRVPAAGTIAVSQFIADEYRAAARSRPVHVIHNAVRFAGAGGEVDIRSRYGIAPVAPLVVWLGRFQRWKGAHVFIEAAARVRQRAPDARFFIVGGEMLGLDPGYGDELKQLVNQFSLGDRLVFTGFAPNVKPFIEAADVVVHSSVRPEPFGLVVLEAMSLGRAVIASASGGPAELVVPRQTGLLTTPGDVPELASAILELIADRSLRNRLGAAAKERVAERFTVAQMMAKLHTLYEQLVPDPPARNEPGIDPSIPDRQVARLVS